ncbi:unnamed protein product [Arctia plantaginis]|uniref:Uncharacterized protein n=1 Tax=Arctia plantaginis TaxID=874455 RepID=A0A8S0YR46_ARCPL|nr:unnamed protein product [Arctia plantaginis]
MTRLVMENAITPMKTPTYVLHRSDGVTKIGVKTVISFCCGVKVNLQGSLSFGKDVLDTLQHYMRRSIPIRRSLGHAKENDVLYLITKTSYLCRDLTFCEGKLEPFINEYITVLTKSIETAFQTILKQEKDPEIENENTTHIFEEELKKLLLEVRQLLRIANTRVTEKTEEYVWIDIIKKICAMFQEAAINYATERMDTNNGNALEIQKKLMQKFVLVTIVVEGKYENTLCTDYNICTKSYECTKALNTLLSSLRNLNEEKIKYFMRSVATGLLDTTFYSHISETTANEFQVILNDMSYSDNVPTKDVLRNIHKAVEERLNAVKTRTFFTGGKDVELVYAILSDMDHFYAKRKADPFHSFLSEFFEWVRMDTKLKSHIHVLINNIADQLLKSPHELEVKLIHEVRAFLELTVDPEN